MPRRPTLATPPRRSSAALPSPGGASSLLRLAAGRVAQAAASAGAAGRSRYGAPLLGRATPRQLSLFGPVRLAG